MKHAFMIFALVGAPLFAQTDSQHDPQPHDMSKMQHDMSQMQHGEHEMPADAVSSFLMQQASGTASNPAAAPMQMEMFRQRDWMLMLHGSAFVNGVTQTGPRGGDRIFSTNWLMGSAERRLGAGHLLLRTMLSLEPAVMTSRGYPELFQTGETAHGAPLVDHQHPHDFFMELAAEYALDLGNNTIAYVYAAPVGDPALGPVAYPHRVSAAEIPQATLSHHLQDSTHIADNVLTLGAKHGALDVGISAFHGQEPDENRWDIDRGAIDSWSVRAQWQPTPNWVAQISTGHLHHPERLEPGNVQRTTASATYTTQMPNGDWSTSLIFGRNRRSDHTASSFVLESDLRFQASNYVTGRFELVDKDELFTNPASSHHGEIFRIKALTLGYTKDVYSTRTLLGGIGGNVTLYGVPATIQDAYGSSPHSFYAFARVRLR